MADMLCAVIPAKTALSKCSDIMQTPDLQMKSVF